MDLSALPTSIAMLVGSFVTATLGFLGYRVTKRKTEIDSTAALVTLIRGINDELRKEIADAKAEITEVRTAMNLVVLERDALRKRVADLEAEVARLSGLLARRGRKVHEAPKVAT